MTPGYRYTTVSSNTHTHTSTINHIFYLPLLYTHSSVHSSLLYSQSSLLCVPFPHFLPPSLLSLIHLAASFFLCQSVNHVRSLPVSLSSYSSSRLIFCFVFRLYLLVGLSFTMFSPSPTLSRSSHFFLFFPLLFYSSSSSSRPLCLTLPLISEQTAGFDERNVNVRSCFCRGKWASERT